MTAKWQPLQRAEIPEGAHPKELVSETAKRLGVSEDDAVRILTDDVKQTEVWLNHLYQVQVRFFICAEWNRSPMVHLNIRRRDGAAIFDWRHRQWIKNQLVGPECEGMEIYPAESRLSDEGNKYHVFCFLDPAIRLPFGFQNRHVVTEEVKSPPGLRQRAVPMDAPNRHHGEKKERIPFMLHVPPDMKQWLADEAARNGSSMNSEVIRSIRMEMDKEKPDGQAPRKAGQ